MNRIALGVAKLSANDLINYCRLREHALKDNPHFPEPIPSLAELAAKRAELNAFVIEGSMGSRLYIKEKNEAAKQLKDMLRQLANYVSFKAGDDERMIMSAGFKTVKRARPMPPPGRIRQLTISRPDKDGRVKLKWKRPKYAVSFRVEYTTASPYDPDTVWTVEAATTRCGIQLDSLEQGTRYWFRVLPMGRRHEGLYSSPTSYLAA